MRAHTALSQLLGLVLSGLIVPLLHPSLAYAKPTAILVNGGDLPSDNSCDFYHDLDRMSSILNGWDLLKASADGPDDKSSLNDAKCDETGNPLRDAAYQKVMVHDEPRGGADIAASPQDLRRAILAKARSSGNGPLVIYFTDHGSNDDGQGKGIHGVALWNSRQFSSVELAGILAEVRRVKPNGNVILIHDHCYSAGMMPEILNHSSARPGMCAFAGASPTEEAYTGQSFANIALKELGSAPRDSQTFEGLFRQFQKNPILSSTPLSSSDVFLANYYDSYHAQLQRPGDEISSLNACMPGTESFERLVQSVSADLAPLLEARVTETSDQLQSLVSQAGISPDATVPDAEKTLKENEAKVARLEKKLSDAEQALIPAQEAWTEAGIAKVAGNKGVQEMNSFRQEIDQLLGKLDQTPVGSPRRKKIENSIQSIDKRMVDTPTGKQSYESLEAKRVAISSSADPSNPNFKSFVESTPGSWPKDALANDVALQTETYGYNSKNHPLRLLVYYAKELSSLGRLAHDPKALSTYLGLVQCENTPIAATEAK